MGNPEKYQASSRRRTNKRKRVFCVKESLDTPTGSLRSSKIKKRNSFDESMNNRDIAPDDYNFIVNFALIKTFIGNYLRCPKCNSADVVFSDELSLRMGYAHKLKLMCQHCQNESVTFTSQECERFNPSQGRNKFKINVRTVIGFREVGKGHEAMVNVARCMNMFSLGNAAYNQINGSLGDAYEQAAEESMKKVASDIKQNTTTNQDPVTCRVSLDGTWQKRGFSSLNGIVTAMNNGRCIDAHVMSKHCKLCGIMERRKNNDDFDYKTWKIQHEESEKCEVNHTKSSGAMEATGAVEIFRRSVEKYGLIYNEYLGDGDTSSFHEVVKSNPYEKHDVVPEKLECVGHVQKRLGTRLRNLVKQHKGTATPISGRGKLTEKTINSMQNFYGIAIRENTHDLYNMKKAVGAILWHCTDFENQEYRHRFCPRGNESWCKYQKDVSAGTNAYKPSINLPEWIHDIIQPIIVTLSSDDLLCKCLHGATQNSNEAVNNIIWNKCPKNVYVGRPVLELGVSSAILEFNEGSFGVNSVFQQYGITNGYCFNLLSERRDRVRTAICDKKVTVVGKSRRKKIRAIKKGLVDKEKELEPKETYVAGGF